jgi:hypothetical protein
VPHACRRPTGVTIPRAEEDVSRPRRRSLPPKLDFYGALRGWLVVSNVSEDDCVCAYEIQF